ncbi:hypothetical protein BV898_00945 [Hypsibius exemplaris]|uniref:Potassium channel domain-containing protein n=1 Tax=Hypsibius exemplaris TaxID=2072580 RepID=A0A1W0XD77_HYPEX|nr:hypothetical protein BV898_00945 [Hypsibius exemplaris]
MRKFSAQDKCMKCRYYCKKFIAFLFSHIGLCGLVVAYVILGAITFSYLEADNERMVKVRVQGLHNSTLDELWNVTHAEPMGDLLDVQETPFPATNILLDIAHSKIVKRRQLEQARRDAAQDLWNITLEMNVLFEKNWTALVNERILQYQNQLLDVLLNDTLAAAATVANRSGSSKNHTAVGGPGDLFNGTDAQDSLRGVLMRYEHKLLQQVRQHGYDGDADTSEQGTVQWSVAGGLLYSLTVITTIGYGHITPKTIWGKLITMLYAIIGIPLMLLCLANIGDALAHAFKFFYWKVCCLYCELKKRRKRLMRIQSVRMSRKSHRSSANTMLSNNVGGGGTQQNNSLHTSFKVRPPSSATLKSQELLKNPNPPVNSHNMTLIRINDDETSPTPSPTHHERVGDSPEHSGTSTERATTSIDHSSTDVTAAAPPTPHETIISFSVEGADSGGNNNKKSTPPPAELKKLPPMAMDDEYGEGVEDEKLMLSIAIPPPGGAGGRKMSVCNMPPETIDGIDYVDETPQHSPTHLSPDEHTQVIIHDVQDDDSHMGGDFEPRYEKVSVPVYICLLVVFGYIIGGSILFASWEGWNLLDGAYFCFITLTTIGFGDFVPGVSSSGDFTNNSEEKLTLCSLYLVFGMALLAMSFNLVQEAATEKAKWIGRKLGILGDESDEDD